MSLQVPLEWTVHWMSVCIVVRDNDYMLCCHSSVVGSFCLWMHQFLPLPHRKLASSKKSSSSRFIDDTIIRREWYMKVLNEKIPSLGLKPSWQSRRKLAGGRSWNREPFTQSNLKGTFVEGLSVCTQGIEAKDPLTSETSKTQLVINYTSGNEESSPTCMNQGLDW